MNYYKYECECLDNTYGWHYQEIDWDKDIVVRQVDWCSGTYRFGEWTGKELIGFILDQKPSELDPPLSADEQISAEEFERVWQKAHNI
jgi:hypothetical protein